MQPEILNQLKSELQSKCVAYDYVDATDNALSDFFINLIVVNKSMEEVNQELFSLVGSDYNPNLTTWFFERKAELENAAQAKQESEKQQQEIQLQQQQQQIQQQQQQVQQQQQQVQQQQQQVQQEQQEVKAEDENMDVAPKTAKADRQNRMFSKAIGSVIGSHEKPTRARSPPPRRSSRSRSRSPVRQSTRYNTDRHDSRNNDRFSSRHDDRHSRRQDDRHDSRQDGDRGRSSILSRLGNSSAQNNTSAGDKPSVFDRLGGARPIPKPTPSTYQERCKYWPNCKNGDECIYVHPSTVCPDFPNCPKTAMECLYIHPEVAKPAIMQPQVKKLPVPCKFFPYCTNPMCPFIHPVAAQQPFFMQAKPFAATGQRVQIPCRDGDNCTRPDCHFLHPKDPNPQAEVVCKFDGACTRPNCFYKHTKENKPNSGKQQNTNARQFSVAEDDVVERIQVGESADLIQNQEQNNTESQPSTMDMDSDVVMDVN